MPRKEVFPPKVHDHRGRARCRFRGRDYYLGPYGSPEADAAYRALLAELAGQPKPVSTGPTLAEPTVADVAAAYLEEQSRVRANRLEYYQIERAATVVLRTHGAVPAARFGCDHVEELQRAMADGSWMTEAEKAARRKGKKPVGWCQNGVNHAVCRVRSMFYWAERRKLVPRGTAEHLRLAPPLTPVSPVRARQTPRRQPTTWEAVRRVSEHCASPADVIVLLLWWTGARPSEICRLRTMDLDTAGDVWLYRPGSDQPHGAHKTAWRGHDKIIPIGPEARRLLAPLLRPDAPDAYLFPPEGPRAAEPHYTAQTLRRAVGRACDRASGQKNPDGVRKDRMRSRVRPTAGPVVRLTPYQIRHSFKKRVAAALGTEAAKHILGHRDSRVTDQYAAGIDLDVAREAARKCG